MVGKSYYMPAKFISFVCLFYVSVSSHKEGAVAKPKRKAISPQRLFRRSKHKYRLVCKDGVTIHVGVM